MRKLGECELFRKGLSASQMNDITFSMKNRLAGADVGIIAPKNIEGELTQLKIKARNGNSGLLTAAIALYETFNGRIRLFNLGASSSGRSPIPISMPFSIIQARNKATETSEILQGTSPAVFMNMYRIGNWNNDESQYIGFSAISDLYTELESGYVAYQMNVLSQYQKVLSNKNILQVLTKIYVWMFSKAVIKAATVYSNDFNTSAAQYLIGRFFLKYVILKQDSDTLDDYAYGATDGRTSLRALQEFEQNADINYSTLSDFLSTFSEAIFNSQILSLIGFQNAWLSLFGEGLGLAVEYLPYLIHFLLGVIHGASLGGVSRLMVYKPDLSKKGLELFYRNLISELK